MRKILYKLSPYFTGINLIIAVVVINLIVLVLPNLQLDLTSNKIHSLSTVTTTTIKDLKDIVKVKVYLSRDLPPQIKPVADSLKIILSQLSSINSGHFRVEYVDPSINDDIKSEAEQLGIQPLQFSTIKSDKLEVSNGYLGLTVDYGGKQEVLPVAGDVGNLEYYLMSVLKRITSNKLPAVAIAGGHGEVASDELQVLGKYLQQNYKVIETDLAKEDIAAEADSLLIIGPKITFDAKSVVRLADWLKKGKGIIALLDRYEVSDALVAQKLPPLGFEELLNNNGIEVEDKLILDESATVATFNSSRGAFISQYPYWLAIRPENFDRSLPVTSGINSLMLAWSSPMMINKGAIALVKSSDRSWTSTEVNDISPTVKMVQPKEDEMKAQPVVAINLENSKVAVVGDSDFIRDRFVVNNQQNLFLILNLIDYFSQDQSLLSIRSKGLDNPPLRQLKDQIKVAVRWGNIFMPVIILALGAGCITWMRKRQ